MNTNLTIESLTKTDTNINITKLIELVHASVFGKESSHSLDLLKHRMSKLRTTRGNKHGKKYKTGFLSIVREINKKKVEMKENCDKSNKSSRKFRFCFVLFFSVFFSFICFFRFFRLFAFFSFFFVFFLVFFVFFFVLMCLKLEVLVK